MGDSQPPPNAIKRELSPVSILKSSTPSINVAKRKSPDSENFQNLQNVLPTKRVKVEFSSEVEVRTLDDIDGKSLPVVVEEVYHALRKRESGSREAYDDIKQMFESSPSPTESMSDSLLAKYLQGLTHHIALLKKHCSDLVHAVLRTRWLTRGPHFISCFTKFLCHLLAHHSGFMTSALRMLAENFSHISTSAGSDFEFSDRGNLQLSVQLALNSIIQLIPSSIPLLRSVLSDAFPPPDDSKLAHIAYVRNLLRLSGYCPEIKSDMLDLITEHLIRLDVELQINTADNDDLEDVEELLENGEQLYGDGLPDPNDDESSDVESVASDDSAISDERRFTYVKETIGKVDAIMDMLFIHYDEALTVKMDPTATEEQRSNPQVSTLEADTTFNQLLMQFGKIVLPTHRSRHTQFLIFHFAQRSKNRMNKFIDFCTLILQDKSRSTNSRLAAASYVASFTARGAYITADIVGCVFDSLASYLDRLRIDYEPGCRGPDLRKYSVYYATAQALIYIFCFRWKDLLADSDSNNDTDDDELLYNGSELKWAAGVKDVFQRNFFCKLNPLKVCTPAIVDEFARMAHQLQFLYIYQILESNKRIRLSMASSMKTAQRETSLTQRHGESYQQLESLFPFDPYKLPSSKKWVSTNYNEWKGVTAPEDDPNTAYDSSDDEEAKLSFNATPGHAIPMMNDSESE